MELGRMHVIDVSESTIRALKIVAIIALILLCKQILSATIGKRSDDKWKMPASDASMNSSAGNSKSEKEKKYWKDVAANIDKEYPASKPKAKKRPEGKKNDLRDAVSDGNIKIRKKPDPVAPVVRKSEGAKNGSAKKPAGKKKSNKKEGDNDGGKDDNQGEK